MCLFLTLPRMGAKPLQGVHNLHVQTGGIRSVLLKKAKVPSSEAIEDAKQS